MLQTKEERGSKRVNQAIPWHHFPIEQPIVINSVHLKRKSAGTPIVFASEDFPCTVYFESN